jgi:hypothetical protein
MIIYSFGRAPSSRQHHQNQQHDRLHSIWDRINDQIAAEHRELAATDPLSPRIKPSVALVGWGLR